MENLAIFTLTHKWALVGAWILASYGPTAVSILALIEFRRIARALGRAEVR